MAKAVTFISLPDDTMEPGLRSLSSFLKSKGYQTRLIFLQQRFKESIDIQIVKEIAGIVQYDLLVGISLMTPLFFLARDLTQKLKSVLNIPVIWGGAHPTVCPEESIQHCDFVCRGEGEIPLYDLLQALERGDNESVVDGIWYRRNGRVVQTTMGSLISDLDILPFPDYSFEEHYLVKEGHLKQIKSTEDIKKFIGYRYPVFTQKGCPFACTYCINHVFVKKYKKSFCRERSFGKVIDELVQILGRFPFIREILFMDDDFFSRDIEELEYFSELYKEKINLPFHINATPRMISREKTKILLDAGMYDISMGIQSGSDQNLKLYRRPGKRKDVLTAVNILHEFKDRLATNYDFILDNPWETDEDCIDSLRLLLDIPRPRRIVFYSLILFPGTPLYDQAKKEGYITDEINQVYRKSYHVDISKGYFNSLFYLFTLFPLPRKICYLLLDKKTINHPFFKIVYFLIAQSTNLFKGAHFFSFVAYSLTIGIFKGDFGLLKHYFKVGFLVLFKRNSTKN